MRTRSTAKPKERRADQPLVKGPAFGELGSGVPLSLCPTLFLLPSRIGADVDSRFDGFPCGRDLKSNSLCEEIHPAVDTFFGGGKLTGRGNTEVRSGAFSGVACALAMARPAKSRIRGLN